jgi:hypothetical protein
MWTEVVQQSLALARRLFIAAAIGDPSPFCSDVEGCGGDSVLMGSSGWTSLYMLQVCRKHVQMGWDG